MVFILFFSVSGWAGEGVIRIKTVKFIQNRLVIAFEHQREDPSDNVHPFIDGIFRTVGVRRDMIMVDDLEPGNHVVELMAVTRDYKIKGACQKVEFNLIDPKSLEAIIGGCGQ